MIGEEFVFDLDNCKEIEHTNDVRCLKLCDSKSKARYFDAEDFNDKYCQFIQDKIESGNLTTSLYNHLQAYGAYNVLYLDVDYKVPHIDGSINDVLGPHDSYLANYYSNTFIAANNLDDYIVSIYVFIPDRYIEVDGMIKCGSHIFIYLNKNVNKAERNEFYKNCKKQVLSNSQLFTSEYISISNDNYDQLFDPQPLLSASVLLPFATKVGAKRNYKLISQDAISYDSLLIFPTVHQEINHEEDELDIEKEICEEELILEYEETISSVMAETLDFISSLRYLGPEHQIWKILASHQLREEKIIKPVYKWLILAQFIQDPKTISTSLRRTTDKLAERLLPIIVMTNKEDEVENTKSKLLAHIREVCEKPFQPKGALELFTNKDVANCAFVIKDVEDSMIISKVNDKFIKAMFPNLSGPEEVGAKVRMIRRSMKTIRTRAIPIYANFSNFIRIVMENMKDEIKPFTTPILDSDILKPNGVRAISNNRKEISFDKIERNMAQNNIYNKTMKRWFRMFICWMFYNTLSCDDSVRKAITTMVSHFVFTTSEKNEEVSYIYNVRQTKLLQQYPYNQWIIDEKSVLLKNWFVIIYKKFIDKELQTDHKATFIKGFMEMLKIFKPTEIGKNAMITPLTNISADIDKLKNNVLISAIEEKHKKNPIKLNIVGDSVYFPMRNGILEFVSHESAETKFKMSGKKAGDYIFYDNNYDKYMNAYTNVYFNKNYPYQSPIHKKVETIFEEIYPKKDLRDYVLMMFGQVLHSIGSRDQIHQFYGTGAEGKSLVNDAISSMLGCGENLFIPLKIPAKYEYDGEIFEEDEVREVKNPFGLATTMDAKNIMTEVKSTHDTGGVVELENKRFASIAEPNTQNYGGNLNVATCKRITGGSSMSGRKIYKAASIFVPKTYITIQTNEILGYSEDNIAVRRRFAVIPHFSRFVTASIEDESMNELSEYSYTFKADTSLSGMFTFNPAYWEALFRILLRYASKFIAENYGGLSDVVKPTIVSNLLEKSTLRSKGLTGWLAENYVKNDEVIRRVSDVIKHIIDTNNMMMASTGENILSENGKISRNAMEKRNFILNSLTTRFGSANRIFKLRSEFWKDGKIIHETVKVGDQELSVSMLSTTKPDDFLLWFDPEPIKTLDLVNDYDGAFIIGFDFVGKKRN